MKKLVIAIACLTVLSFLSHSQKKYTPIVVPCDCHFKVDSNYIATAPNALKADSIFPYHVDSSFKTQCGYLVVPENRKKASSRMIRLPFIIVRSKNSNKKKDPVLFTGGGPGNSSLGWANGITRSSLIDDRDCIAFEQRGTRYSLPYLRLFDLDETIREAYRKDLSIDSMTLVGLTRYRQRLLAKGIDIDGYNSDETVSDIADLLRVLPVDSVNLIGGSYSGGLMLAVLQHIPSRVRSLVLDSPLPMFSPIDEDEPVNFNEGLHALFLHVEKDSADQARYGQLEKRFREYFTSITGKFFYQSYLERGHSDSMRVRYTKNDLLDVIVGGMLDNSRTKDVPFMITEMISGRHEPYIKQRLDNIFNKYTAPDGMRISVYCADQATYHRPGIVQQLYGLYPYMAGYHINDVYKPMCDCWNVPPVNPRTKQPFYSAAPVLIGDGEMDAACRPLYMSLLHHYLPNSQCFLFMNRGHGVGGKDFFSMTQQFIDQPFRKITPPNEGVIAY